jgi:hypothetical protein
MPLSSLGSYDDYEEPLDHVWEALSSGLGRPHFSPCRNSLEGVTFSFGLHFDNLVELFDLVESNLPPEIFVVMTI